MNGNYRIVEHRTRYRARCAWRFTQYAAREFWRGFAQPVLIVAIGVAISAPMAKMAGSVIAYLMER